jgi:hypothetical protein
MSFSPPVGAIAFGRSGAGYPVIGVQPDRILLKRDGAPWAVNPVAIVRWELPPLPTANPFPIGTAVGKAHNLGWLGWVQTEPIDGWCDVLWQYDKHLTLEKLTDLKLKEI